MTPAARMAAAMEVLDAWRDGLPIEQALTRWARGARYAGSKDRAGVRDHVFDVLRRKGSCEAAGGAADGRGLVLGLARLSGMDVADLFSGAGHGPAPLTVEEAAHPIPEPDAARDIPDWVRPMLAARAPDDPARLFEGFTHRAPVWLRVNLRRGTREAACASLAKEGVVTRPHPDVKTALEATENARRIRQSEAYLTGLVELQDLSVQHAVLRLDWPRDGRILDYCAGGGGKSLAIADRTGAEITAHDAFPGRMADLAPRAARAGVQISQAKTDMLRDDYCVVLTDVPCSGSGTWRRDPEAKWRLTSGDLDLLTTTQDQILDAAAALVGPGGRLIYMTCSLFEVENEARIAAFVARHPDWQVDAQHLDTPLSASDGFYTCEMSRR